MSENKQPLLLIALAVAVAVLFAISFSSTKNDSEFIDKLAKSKDPIELKIPILMYHYVEYNQDEADFLRDSQNVPPHIFEQQIIDLKNAGYTFITPKDLDKIMKKKEQKRYVILSFDDGFKDFYTDAFPILKKHNVTAISYIVYSFLDGQDYMSWDQAREVAGHNLIEIGSHTLNHAYLPGIQEEYATNELVLSKKNLEADFGVKVTSFAYPYGNYDKKTLELVKKAGYTNAVTVELGNIVNSDHMFELKRIRPGHITGQALINYIEKSY